MAVLLLLTLFVLPILLTLVAAANRGRTILNPSRRKPLRHGRNNPNESSHILIVLGSGGHTAEMMSMLHKAVVSTDAKERIEWHDFKYRTWVVSEGDNISAVRAREFEEMLDSSTTNAGTRETRKSVDTGKWMVHTVPRARKIHQPLYTSPISSLRCLLACWQVLTSQISSTCDGHASQAREIDFPDLILCNGPATATILVFTSLILRFFDFKGCETRGRMRTVYVESWARVKKPSLSGRLLSKVVDRFLVQWEQLEGFAGRAEYRGVLV
nr:udp-n-acetylglucosamine transferase subunit alg14 [Quercus suber]